MKLDRWDYFTIITHNRVNFYNFYFVILINEVKYITKERYIRTPQKVVAGMLVQIAQRRHCLRSLKNDRSMLHSSRNGKCA